VSTTYDSDVAHIRSELCDAFMSAEATSVVTGSTEWFASSAGKWLSKEADLSAARFTHHRTFGLIVTPVYVLFSMYRFHHDATLKDQEYVKHIV
jgi:hypothetical protein